jgi:hypothetical protein
MKLATATDFTSIVSLAGSLTPFLFPSRWIQTVESQHLARADAHAGVALRADVGFIAETLALSYLRDRDSLLKLQEELTLVRPLRDELLARERLGLVEPGTSEELALLVGDLEMTAEALGTELVAERATLAETLGFMNPEAILEIEDPGNPAVLLPNEEELRRSREIAPFMSYGSFTGDAPLGTCAFWPVPPTSTPHTISAPGLAATVVVSTTHDPATPYKAGVDLANELRASLLTFDGTQHTVVFQGDNCIDDYITTYLIGGSTPPSGAKC